MQKRASNEIEWVTGNKYAAWRSTSYAAVPPMPLLCDTCVNPKGRAIVCRSCEPEATAKYFELRVNVVD